MDAAIIVALIALAGTVGNVGLPHLLDARAQRQRSDAQWARYKQSLAAAAFDVNARIENVLRGFFVDAYAHGPHETEVVQGTLFRFAQYFGWAEIVRRYARDPDVRHRDEMPRVGQLANEVARVFNTDEYGAGGFMVWREAQRAIGELMVTRDGDAVDTIGVADFVSALDKFQPWMGRMAEMIRTGDPAGWQTASPRRTPARWSRTARAPRGRAQAPPPRRRHPAAPR